VGGRSDAAAGVIRGATLTLSPFFEYSVPAIAPTYLLPGFLLFFPNEIDPLPAMIVDINNGALLSTAWGKFCGELWGRVHPS